MSLDLFQYDRMMERAMRGVVREALTKAATDGLPGQHHFYISFRTGFPGVHISDALHSRFPEDMTIVLQHQYWDLSVFKDFFEVTLSFAGVHEKLVIPFAAITGFVDPSVKFGLQFKPDAEVAQAKTNAPSPMRALEKASQPPDGPAQIVSIDAFRKK